jgi:hypothetical protein
MKLAFLCQWLKRECHFALRPPGSPLQSGCRRCKDAPFCLMLTQPRSSRGVDSAMSHTEVTKLYTLLTSSALLALLAGATSDIGCYFGKYLNFRYSTTIRYNGRTRIVSRSGNGWRAKKWQRMDRFCGQSDNVPGKRADRQA